MQIKPYTPLTDKLRPVLDYRIKKVEQSPYRPTYHIVPPCGLLNDPNGLCYFNGKYHTFYQWYPFEAKHDMKHWNHVSSNDLLNWSDESGILIPDEPYEKNGCYSGNAYVDNENERVYLYYTANYKDNDGVRIPQQALAIMDSNGEIKKLENNPIIKGAPENISENIRDPFVFKVNDRFYMFLGAENVNHQGCLLVYSANEPENWHYEGVLNLEYNGKSIDLGTMVECPGIILGEKDVLFLSLINSKLEGIEHVNRFDTIALIGNLDLEKLEFKIDNIQTVDYGFDFYAPQPFYSKDNEPLFYGWFGCATEELPEDKFYWRHGLTFPRKIIIDNEKIKTPVIDEIKDQFKTIEITDANPDLFYSSKEPILIKWSLKDDDKKHILKIGSPDDYYKLIVDFKNDTVSIDRTNLKEIIDPDYGFIRTIPIETGDLDVELFLDNSFNELYLNNGEKVLSFRSYEKNLVE